MPHDELPAQGRCGQDHPSAQLFVLIAHLEGEVGAVALPAVRTGVELVVAGHEVAHTGGDVKRGRSCRRQDEGVEPSSRRVSRKEPASCPTLMPR